MRLRLALLACFATAALVFGREQSSTNTPLSLEQVGIAIAAHVNQERFEQAQWGVKIASVQSGTVLFETNSEKLLKPASNAKLYTGALALDQLGPDYKIRTSLCASANAENGVLKSDLIVYGRGDPSFSHTFGETNALDKIRSGHSRRRRPAHRRRSRGRQHFLSGVTLRIGLDVGRFAILLRRRSHRSLVLTIT
jgi:D-alanyl-D-alanine carboxypeptidase